MFAFPSKEDQSYLMDQLLCTPLRINQSYFQLVCTSCKLILVVSTLNYYVRRSIIWKWWWIKLVLSSLMALSERNLRLYVLRWYFFYTIVIKDTLTHACTDSLWNWKIWSILFSCKPRWILVFYVSKPRLILAFYVSNSA